MASNTELARLVGLIKAKRREMGIGLREAAKASGVSPSTLSRLERGDSSSFPDTKTLTNLAAWLNVPIGSLISDTPGLKKKEAPRMATPDKVEVYLRADKNLTSETAASLSEMFRMLYTQLADTKKPTKP